MKRSPHLLVLVIMILTTGFAGKDEAQAAAPGCFPNVPTIVDCIHPLFLTYWNQQNGLHNFGYPIRPRQECWLNDAPEPPNGNKYRKLQWFQRHRLESHPKNSGIYQVQLGLLGYEVINRVDPPAPQLAGWHFFNETGHNVGGGFDTEWGDTGLEFRNPTSDRDDEESLALNGLPITELQHNVPVENPVGSGKFVNLDVQWFQRARYEIPPNGGSVTRGLLGSQLVRTFVCSTRPILAASEEASLRDTAGQQELDFNDLAEEQPALYTSTSGSLGIIAIPPVKPLNISAADLDSSLKPLIGQVVGGVIVLDNSLPGIDSGRYIVSVDRDSGALSLFSNEKKLPFIQAAVRSLAVPLQQPKVLISTSAICFAWNVTQICGQIDLPIRGADAIIEAAKSIGIDQQIDANQTVALIAGEEQQLECARGFAAAEGPDYTRCVGSILAAPALSDEAMKRPLGDAAVGLGIVLVPNVIREEVYKGPTRTSLIFDLPAGIYQAFEFPTPDDRHLIDSVRATWVALFDGKEVFFLPAVAGGQLEGDLLKPDDRIRPLNAAVTSSLILRNRCFFAASQCSWLELP